MATTITPSAPVTDIGTIDLAPPPPGAPRDSIALATNTQVTVSWDPPVSDGGSPITGYAVTAEPGGRTCSTSTALTCTVTQLTNGTSYTFTVRATSTAGTGPASEPTSPVTPATLVLPVVSGTPSGNAVNVGWTAPESDGGAPVIGYLVTLSPGGHSCSTNGGLSCTINGLADAEYTASVTATNRIGTSGPSGPSASFLIDASRPGATLAFPASPTNTAAISYTVAFSEPVTGLAASDFPRSGTATGCTVGEPTGSAARLHGRRHRLLGEAPSSSRSPPMPSPTPPATPGPPSRSPSAVVTIDRPLRSTSSLTVKPATGATLSGSSIPLTLTWSGSDNSGGSGIARYELARSANGGILDERLHLAHREVGERDGSLLGHGPLPGPCGR